MKKLIFLSLLFASLQAYSQGIKLSGQTFTDPTTHFHIDSLFAYASYSYSSVDSMVNLTLPVAISQTDAKAGNIIRNATIYGIPLTINFVFKSGTGYPTSSSLYNTVKPILQAAPYNFTVTTF